MKTAIMQPYFFPYIGYWQLIAAVDVFVVYDDVQYIKGGWINRNNILLNGAASWITLPVSSGHQQDRINQRHFVDYPHHCGKILKKLTAAYQKAPHFSEVKILFESLLAMETDNVANTLGRQLQQLAEHLGIATKFVNSSELNKADAGLAGQDRIIHICRATQADAYYNSIGGMPLYDQKAFVEAGINLRFIQPRPHIYEQFGQAFVPNLSILDALMFNSPAQIQDLLRQFELVEKSAIY